jgi:hypothetical protein
MRLAVAVIRLAVAILIIAAVVGQLIHSITFWQANGVQQIGISVWNFFSFFTVESNLLAVVAFAVGGVMLLRSHGMEPAGWTTFRACVATYMIITGIVYNLLLRGIALPQGATLEWSNEVLHLIAPIALLLDWILAPGRGRLPWSRIGVIVIFPIVWIVYTLIRGPFITNEVTGDPYWYPYPFLNPNLPGASPWTVAGYSAVIAIAIIAVGLIVILVSRRMRPLATPVTAAS